MFNVSRLPHVNFNLHLVSNIQMSKAISAVVNKMFVEYGLVYFNFLVNVVNVVEMDVCWTQFVVVQFSSGGTFLLHTDAQLPMPPWSITGASSLWTTPIIASTLL